MISCKVVDLGLIGYREAFNFQQEVLQQRIKGERPDTLILCEHFPVFTLGRLGKPENILADRDTLNKLGLEMISVNRGGDITFHGPGQLVIYPIFDLAEYGKDLRSFLNSLEQVAIEFLRYLGCFAYSRSGFRGVWVGNKKIASIGIGVKKWVSFHGLAINISTALDFFSLIKPCGLDISMTSLSQEIVSEVDMALAKELIIDKFKDTFGLMLNTPY